MPKTVSKTDLTRRTREIVNLVERSNVVIVESYGEECTVLLDVLSYRLLTAFANNGQPADPDDNIDPKLREINRVVAAYLASELDVDEVAEILRVSRFELLDRFAHLGILAQ